MAGSWFTACKVCSSCQASLVAGTTRYSCRVCGYHLCPECAARRSQQSLSEEITVTVYRAALPGIIRGTGIDEDTLQARVLRGATAAALKARLQEVYGLPAGLQELRRDADSPPLRDHELLRCEDGDVVYLRAGLAAGALGAGLTKAMESAAQAVVEAMSEVENREYRLTLVMPVAHECGSRAERRCQVAVVAGARVAELLDMAKLELDAEGECLALEFAGDRLPAGAPLHMLRLGDGDTVMVVPEVATQSL